MPGQIICCTGRILMAILTFFVYRFTASLYRHKQQRLKPATAVSHSEAWLDGILSEAEYFKAYYGNLDMYSDTIKDARWVQGTAFDADLPAMEKPYLSWH